MPPYFEEMFNEFYQNDYEEMMRQAQAMENALQDVEHIEASYEWDDTHSYIDGL